MKHQSSELAKHHTTTGNEGAQPPAQNAPDTAQQPTEFQTPQNVHVLLVDENITSRMILSGMLSRMNISSDSAENGIEMITALQKKKYTLVLLDIQTPDMNGYEVVAQIRDSSSGVTDTEIPIIAMSAFDAEDECEKCLASGMNDYLSKPVDPELLSSAITRHIRYRKQQTVSAAMTDATGEAAVPLPVFDYKGISERLLDDKELIFKILQVFFTDAKLKIASLKEAFNKNDTEKIELIGHTLKGAAANTGLEQFRNVAESVEKAGRSRDLSTLSRSIEELETAYDNAAEYIREFFPSLDLPLTP